MRHSYFWSYFGKSDYSNDYFLLSKTTNQQTKQQIDVCDVISLCTTRAVLIYVFLLVARPNCFVVNELLYKKYSLFKPTTNEQNDLKNTNFKLQ